MLEACFSFHGAEALDGAGVPRFKRNVKVLLNAEAAVGAEGEVGDEDACGQTKENLDDVVVNRPIRDPHGTFAPGDVAPCFNGRMMRLHGAEEASTHHQGLSS